LPGQVQLLTVLRQECPACGELLHWRYENCRTVVTWGGMLGLRMRISRCENASCERYHRPYRPEAEGALVLPQHEFGLDVLALVGALRYQEHRSVPEIHAVLVARGVAICERSGAIPCTGPLSTWDGCLARCSCVTTWPWLTSGAKSTRCSRVVNPCISSSARFTAAGSRQSEAGDLTNCGRSRVRTRC
jgi:hypothetical protein